MVQGASGTGKSSLVRAGVLPRLERDRDRWLVVPPVRPLMQPFRQLADAIAVALGAPAIATPADAVVDRHAWSRWIIEAERELRRRTGHLDATVLLTIDQLEEALRPGDPVGEAFLLSLRDALATGDHHLVALAMLRTDFTGRLQRHAMLRESFLPGGEILATRAFQLGPMPRSSFHAVIEGPAALAGLELEAGLTSRLVDDTRTEDALPLLAFVLRELWTGHGKKDLRLTGNDYQRFGGLENAVGDHAERIFSDLKPSDTEIEALRTTFLGMADLSPEGGIVRRPLRWTEVPDEARSLTEAFANARLLVADQLGIEVAHDALFRRWKKLAGWIEAGRDDLRLKRRIETAYEAWKAESPHKPSRLLPPGRPLEEALDLCSRWGTQLSGEMREFVMASRRAARRNRVRLIATALGAIAAVPMIAGLIWMGMVWLGVRSVEAEMEFLSIPAGCFEMGSPESEAGRYSNEWQVPGVCVRTFELARFELTQDQWRRVMIHHANPSSFMGDGRLPVESVSWNDAKLFVRLMSVFGRHGYRLPSEAEWEYAARAGTSTSKYWGERAEDGCAYENIGDLSLTKAEPDAIVANCDDGHINTAPVGSFRPNSFGLQDMLGNVGEWTEDCYVQDRRRAPKDGTAVTEAECPSRVFRGSSWSGFPRYLRAAFRYNESPDFRSNYVGIRIARTSSP
jgi:formylglycine-generating enzyme required for sulfatase activity